jgi:hypothetical protein
VTRQGTSLEKHGISKVGGLGFLAGNHEVISTDGSNYT